MHTLYKNKLRKYAKITLALTAYTTLYNFIESYSPTLTVISLTSATSFAILVLKILENPEQYNEDVIK